MSGNDEQPQNDSNQVDPFADAINRGDVFSSYAQEQEIAIQKLEFNKNFVRIFSILFMIIPVVRTPRVTLLSKSGDLFVAYFF